MSDTITFRDLALTLATQTSNRRFSRSSRFFGKPKDGKEVIAWFPLSIWLRVDSHVEEPTRPRD